MPAKSKRRTAADDSGGVLPLYYQVYYLLRKELLNRLHPPGKPLPNEVDLARRFRVARVTVRRALARLESEKLIVRKRGRHGGTFPLEVVEQPRARATIDGLQYQIPRNIEARHEVLSITAVPLPAGLAERWGEKTRGKVVRIRRRLILDDGPMAVVDTYAPLKYRPLLEKTKLLRGMVLTLLTRIVPSSADQVITITATERDITRLLAMPAGSPVVHVSLSIRDARGRMIESLEAKYRPDRFLHRLALFPVDSVMP